MTHIGVSITIAAAICVEFRFHEGGGRNAIPVMGPVLAVIKSSCQTKLNIILRSDLGVVAVVGQYLFGVYPEALRSQPL